MSTSADAELRDRLLDGDDDALKEVMQRFGGLVYSMARRVVADPALAQEVAQDTFLALWRRPGSFDPGRGSMQSFLLGVTRNKSIDLVRREESTRRTRDALLQEAEASTRPAPTESTAEMDERHDLKAALAQLSGVQREALVLAYFGGRTYREVADELGIPEGTAKTRLRDGLQKLRQLMSSPRESGK